MYFFSNQTDMKASFGCINWLTAKLEVLPMYEPYLYDASIPVADKTKRWIIYQNLISIICKDILLNKNIDTHKLVSKQQRLL